MGGKHQAGSDSVHRICAGVLAVGLLLSLLMGWALADSRRATWSDAAANSMMLTTSLARDIGQVVQTDDLSLQSAAQTMGAATAGTPQRDILFEAAGDVALFVTDPDGHVVGMSGKAVPDEADVARDDYFVAQRQNAAVGLFMSQPHWNRHAQAWAIVLSRRISDPEGRFAGIVARPIPYSAFAEMFSRVDLGSKTITLLADDGTILYRVPPGGGAPVQGHGSAGLLQRLAEGRLAPYEAVSDSSGKPALIAFARVDRHPLVLSVTTDLADLYAGWTAKAALVVILSVILVVAGGLLIRALQRRQWGLHQAERHELGLYEQARHESERQHAGKMEAVARLTAGVAHDFNNHLQTIISSLEIISSDYLVEQEAKEIAQIAHKAASKGAKLTHRLLTFSRQQVLQPRRVSVAFLLSDLRKLVADSRIFATEIRCEIAVEPFTDDLYVDGTQVESCLLNLLLNARDAMPHGGTLHLEGRNAGPGDQPFGSLTPARHVILTVRDTGRGMDAETRSHAFEPFFTTKAFGTGAGLGLSMAQGFCHQSGGDIRILANQDRRGTAIELWLPAAFPDMPEDDEVEFNYATIGRRTGRILLVEDEQDVLVTLSAILISGGFEVVSVNNGADGLMRLHDREPYDAVLADHSMPDMSGAEFLRRVAVELPNLPRLMLSGAEIEDAALDALPQPVRLLRKPIGRLSLMNAVRTVIGENSQFVMN